MRRIGMVLTFSMGIIILGVAIVAAHTVFLLDDCDPDDYNRVPPPAGGCALPKGDVTLDEFNDELVSPLATAVIGHQAWRNNPAYLKIRPGATVHVKNKGGRNHTFTGVAEFGGGTVPPLNVGLTLAPECAAAVILPPGASIRVSEQDLPDIPGNYRFQCCLHPWMRTLIKVLD